MKFRGFILVKPRSLTAQFLAQDSINKALSKLGFLVLPADNFDDLAIINDVADDIEDDNDLIGFAVEEANEEFEDFEVEHDSN